MPLTIPDPHSNQIIGLVDAHAFYVGCETVFDPKLLGKPVVVLSSNDGCVTARSDAAKALGIKMSQPAFELKDLVRRHGLIVRSSNFALYHDMHRRMMMAIAECVPEIDIYSVDECFFLADGMDKHWDIEQLAHHIQSSVLKKTGLPVGVGISRTKTTAKLCNWASKKWKAKTGSVVTLLEPERMTKLLDYADVGEVWGVGSRLKAKMQLMVIKTAGDLARADSKLIRSTFGVTVLRTQQELKWQTCFGFNETPEPQKSFTMSRSFGQKIHDLAGLKVAISTFTAKLAVKLRRQRVLATCIKVFMATNRFDLIDEYTQCATMVSFARPTNDTRELLNAANQALQAIYVDGRAWSRAGVLILDTVAEQAFIPDLFAPAPPKGSAELMTTIDKINRRMGEQAVTFGHQSKEINFRVNSAYASPRYTTSWEDIIEAW